MEWVDNKSSSIMVVEEECVNRTVEDPAAFKLKELSDNLSNINKINHIKINNNNTNNNPNNINSHNKIKCKEFKNK